MPKAFGNWLEPICPFGAERWGCEKEETKCRLRSEGIFVQLATDEVTSCDYAAHAMTYEYDTRSSLYSGVSYSLSEIRNDIIEIVVRTEYASLIGVCEDAGIAEGVVLN